MIENSTSGRPTTGFSLIELMIVVAIIGVLAAIAYPAYQEHVSKSRRSDGMAALASLMNAMERYRSTNMGSYTGATAAGVYRATSEEGYYNLAVTVTGGGSGYTATATAVSGGLQANDTLTDGTVCTTLSLTSTGVKSPSACW